MKHKTRDLTQAAVLDALYVALTFLQNILLPGTTSMAIQFRASEALCVFALFTPSAVWGLGIGCMIYNLSYAGALPLDFFVGTCATLLATLAMYQFRKVTLFKVPILALLMPALFNGLLVGWELTIYIGSTFWLNALYVAIGELGVLLTLGVALYFTLNRKSLKQKLFGR